MSWMYKPKAARGRKGQKTGTTARPPLGTWPGVRLVTERLEDRTLPRPTMYVDFGDGFQNGVLTDTLGNLITARSGTNPAVNGPDLVSSFGFKASDPLEMRSFDSVIGPEAAAARKTIMALVRRYYEPTNIEVVELTNTPVTLSTGETVKAPSSLAEVSAILGANNKNQRKNDTYNFVTQVFANNFDLLAVGLLGISNGTDIFNFNRTEGATLTMVGDSLTSGNPSAVDLAITLAHEAGHSFGLKHAYYTAGQPIPDPEGQDAKQLQSSEIMSYLTPLQLLGEFYAASAFFTRFPTIQGDGNFDYNVLEGANGTKGPIDQFFTDPEVGQNPNLEYVTGTGANDIISITRSGPNQAKVSVSPFVNPDFTGPITVPGTFGKGNTSTYSYTIALDKPITVDGGLGGDRFIIDASLGTTISIRGQGDDTPDSLIIDGGGTGSAVFTPGTNVLPFFDDSLDFQGKVTIGKTVVNFSEFDTGSVLTAKNLAAVTVATPAGRDSISVTAVGKLFQVGGKVAGTVPIVPVLLDGVGRVAVDTGGGDTPAAGDDILTLSFGTSNPIPSGGFTFTGGAGKDALVVTADADFALSAAQLDVVSFGAIALSGVEIADLTGGKSANTATVTDWAGAVRVTGDSKDLVRVVNDTDFTLTGTKILGSNGLVATLNKITKAEVTGGPGANVFTLSGFTGVVTLDGAGGADTYALDAASPGVQVAESGADAATDTLALTGTKGADVVTVSRASVRFGNTTVPLPGGGKIESFAIDGADGNDAFTVDVGGGLLTGGALNLSGGAGKNTLNLIGNPGARIAQGSVALGTGGTATVIFDPNGSTGPVQAGPAGTDAMVVTTSGFEPVVTIIPVDRFDVVFGAADDAITIDKAAPLTGVETVGVLAGGQGVRVGRAGALSVHGGAGADKFTINTPTAAGLSALTAYGNQVTVAGGAADDNAADQFELRAAAVPVSLFGQGGDDAFTVGAAPNLPGGADGVTGAVTVVGGAGTNVLTLSDAGSAAGNADVRVTPTGVTGLVGKAGNVPLTFTDIGRLAIFGSNAAAAEAFTIDGATLPIDLLTGAGPDAVTVLNVTAPLSLDAGAGDDAVTLSDATPPGGLAVQLGDGNNTARLTRVSVPAGLTVLAGAGNDTVDIDSLGGPVTIDVGAGDNALTLTRVSVPGQLALATGPGNDTVLFTDVSTPGGLSVATGGGNDVVGVNAVRATTVVDTGDGNDRVTANAIEAAAAITTGAGDDEVVIGGPTLEAILVPPAIDGGAGTDRVTLDDSGNPLDTVYTITPAGVSRGGQAPLGFTSIEASGLLPGVGNNTYSVVGTPAGGVNLIDGPGNGTFVIAPGALNGPNAFVGGDGNDSFNVNVGGGIPDAGLAITGGNGADVLTLAGRPGDDSVTYRLTAAGAGKVLGLGGAATVAGVETTAIDGAGGGNALSLLDDSNAVYGTALAPDGGVVVRPTAAGAGELRVGGSAAVVRYSNFGNGLTVNGDSDGSGDADVLTVLGFSAGGSSAGEAVADDGSDRVAVSDRELVLENGSVGQALRLTLGEAGGKPTFRTLVLRTGNEAAPGGDQITVTPSDRVNLVVDAMGPDGAAGSAGDRLTVLARGARTVEVVPEDPARGPGQTRLTLDKSGLSVGYIGFENAPRANTNRVRPDGVPVFAVASGPGTPSLVRVFEPVSGAQLFEFRPYDPSFLGGVSVATGDVTGDGVLDVIVGAGPGGGPHVQVFDGATQAVVRSFFPYEETFTGGVQVSAGDIDGDGAADIILGTGITGGPRVQVVSGRTGEVLQNYFAYEPSFRNGVQVAAGDVNGDGVVDVVTGSGAGGGPRVRAFSGLDGAPVYDFFAYDDTSRTGVNVAAGDVDADGIADIITGPGSAGVPNVRAFSGATGGRIADIGVGDFSSGPQPAIRVTTVDLDGDGVDDILTAQGAGAFPLVRGFKLVLPDDPTAPPSGVEVVREQAVFDDAFSFGVFVG